ncbi:MAG: C39 family peptidase [Thermoanaerobaculales bacterium]|nr:C39 family peptidase [Thermoanaerobaculales bacterium]
MRSHAPPVALGLLILLVLPAAVAWGDENPYLINRVQLPGGETLDVVITPALPPAFKMPAVEIPESAGSRAAVYLSEVPAFNWCYGCSATSGAMIAGYYDRNGYPDMYSGPTNGGVCPLNNSLWGYGESPLSATHQGYDGLGVRGHVDDYWVSSSSTIDDPYITGAWTQHTHADCTGDFMKTNQSAYGNNDGSTRWFYYGSGSPYSNPGTGNADGGYGLKLFFESRGSTVLSHFNQYIYGWEGNTLGCTFDEYVAEIDAGRPVIIHVSGHSMVGFGYNTAGNLVYLHDTWDYNNHQMTWGGSYSGRDHYAVSFFRLEASTVIFNDGFESGGTTEWSGVVGG